MDLSFDIGSRVVLVSGGGAGIAPVVAIANNTFSTPNAANDTYVQIVAQSAQGTNTYTTLPSWTIVVNMPASGGAAC